MFYRTTLFNKGSCKHCTVSMSQYSGASFPLTLSISILTDICDVSEQSYWKSLRVNQINPLYLPVLRPNCQLLGSISQWENPFFQYLPGKITKEFQTLGFKIALLENALRRQKSIHNSTQTNRRETFWKRVKAKLYFFQVKHCCLF